MTNLVVIVVKYEKDLKVIDEILPHHRAYLKLGYESGKLLASGPQNPKIGGVIIGKFESREEALAFTQNDPYALQNAASYQIIEFNPVLHQDFLNNFLEA